MPFISFNPKISKYDDYTEETYKEKLFSSLIALLSTPRGTHPYDPNYGVGIRSFILDTDVGQIQSLIENDISTSIQTYIPEIYNNTKVVVTRDIHPSGIGYIYKLKIVISNVIVDFNIMKNGSLMYVNSYK